VSADGGTNPVWNPQGGELFYQLTNSLYAVKVENGRRVGAPVRLFDRPAGNPQRNWDVAPDGQRFIMAGYARTRYVHVVLNWFEELKAKVR